MNEDSICSGLSISAGTFECFLFPQPALNVSVRHPQLQIGVSMAVSMSYGLAVALEAVLHLSRLDFLSLARLYY